MIHIDDFPIVQCLTSVIFPRHFFMTEMNPRNIRTAAFLRQASKKYKNAMVDFPCYYPPNILFSEVPDTCSFCFMPIEHENFNTIFRNTPHRFASRLPGRIAFVVCHNNQACTRGCGVLFFQYVKGKIMQIVETMRPVLTHEETLALDHMNVYEAGHSHLLKIYIRKIVEILKRVEDMEELLQTHYLEPRIQLFNAVVGMNPRNSFPTKLVLPENNVGSCICAFDSGFLMFRDGCATLNLVTPMFSERFAICMLYRLFVFNASNYNPTQYPDHFCEAFGNVSISHRQEFVMNPAFLHILQAAYIAFIALWNPFKSDTLICREQALYQYRNSNAINLSHDMIGMYAAFKDKLYAWSVRFRLSYNHADMIKDLSRGCVPEAGEREIVQFHLADELDFVNPHKTMIKPRAMAAFNVVFVQQ